MACETLPLHVYIVCRISAHNKDKYCRSLTTLPAYAFGSFMLSVRVRVTAPDAKAALAMIKGRARAHDRMACTMEDPLSVWGPPVDLVDVAAPSCLSPGFFISRRKHAWILPGFLDPDFQDKHFEKALSRTNLYHVRPMNLEAYRGRLGSWLQCLVLGAFSTLIRGGSCCRVRIPHFGHY